MITFNCRRCMTEIRCSPQITTVRCRCCGEAYLTRDGEPPRAMYPALFMRPIDTVHEFAALSMWMLPHERPVQAGWYDCRFGDTYCRLYWNGWKFLITPRGKGVCMVGYTSFRGVLAP